MVLMHTIKVLFPPFAIVFSMRYNSPAVMMASVMMFLWVMTWTMQSKVINWISASVLSVYIVHMSKVGEHLFFAPLKWMDANLSMEWICIVAFMVAFYMACVVFDKLRILICTPIARWLSFKAERFTMIYFIKN